MSKAGNIGKSKAPAGIGTGDNECSRIGAFLVDLLAGVRSRPLTPLKRSERRLFSAFGRGEGGGEGVSALRGDEGVLERSVSISSGASGGGLAVPVAEASDGGTMVAMDVVEAIESGMCIRGGRGVRALFCMLL